MDRIIEEKKLEAERSPKACEESQSQEQDGQDTGGSVGVGQGVLCRPVHRWTWGGRVSDDLGTVILAGKPVNWKTFLKQHRLAFRKHPRELQWLESPVDLRKYHNS